MTKPVVLLDVDGVFADFSRSYVDAIARELGAHRVPSTPVDRWEIHHWARMTEDERRRVDARVLERGWCRGIHPLPGAVDAAARLREEAECIALTAAWNGPHWHAERLEWIREHMGIDHRHVIFAHRKDRVDGDMLLDDKPENVTDWARAKAWRGAVPGLPARWHALLWHASHNASAGDVPGGRRVFAWSEVHAAVARLREG